jgi:hypothetical protein
VLTRSLLGLAHSGRGRSNRQLFFLCVLRSGGSSAPAGQWVATELLKSNASRAQRAVKAGESRRRTSGVSSSRGVRDSERVRSEGGRAGGVRGPLVASGKALACVGRCGSCRCDGATLAKELADCQGADGRWCVKKFAFWCKVALPPEGSLPDEFVVLARLPFALESHLFSLAGTGTHFRLRDGRVPNEETSVPPGRCAVGSEDSVLAAGA